MDGESGIGGRLSADFQIGFFPVFFKVNGAIVCGLSKPVPPEYLWVTSASFASDGLRPVKELTQSGGRLSTDYRVAQDLPCLGDAVGVTQAWLELDPDNTVYLKRTTSEPAQLETTMQALIEAYPDKKFVAYCKKL